MSSGKGSAGPTSSGDSRFFAPSKKGEVHELRTELESGKEERQVNALKKVIAGMTVGKDVSVLFPNVVKCITTKNIELKKLVYLYIMNYAKSKPDLAILAVNAFVKDTQDPNPLLRALAVRTMGCIRVQRITEYLCQPLHACLKDSDPYVRKTAAVCVAKLWDISADLVENQGFLDILIDLLADPNPMVVANAVAALSEIQETTTKRILNINFQLISKLLAALNECTEWGQVFILNFLSNYVPSEPRDAESLAERITQRFQHANSAVVLAALKAVLKYMDVITSSEVIRSLMKKMAPPLITLLSKEPEIQYVALRNINLIVQKRPNILMNEMKVFFCKYNDPIYVKMEKLELMIMLVREATVEQVLNELKEYATEADVEFVRKSVRAIGRCAIKLENSAERCIQVLLNLIKSQVTYVVHEAIIVIKDIFRKYPGKYESIISTLCENLADDAIDEPEARAAMIWIIGEYSDRIDNSDELLENFLDNFHDEPAEVQLQLLTASVKLFLHKPKVAKGIVRDALNMATRESENPDLRDRGFIYWRLLSNNPEAAKKVVLSQKPLISDASLQLEEGLLNTLVDNISTLASIYHKPPETFVSRLRRLHKSKEYQGKQGAEGRDESPAPGPSQPTALPEPVAKPVEVAPSGPNVMDDLLSLDFGGGNAPAPAGPVSGMSGGDGIMDLLGGGDPSPGGGYPAPGGGYPTPGAGYPGFGGGPPQPQGAMVIDSATGGGMEITGSISRVGGRPVFDATLSNKGNMPLSGFEVRFNKNTYGLAAQNGTMHADMLNPGQSVPCRVELSSGGPLPPAGSPASTVLDVAVRNSSGKVAFGKVPLPLSAVLVEDGKLQSRAYLEMWQGQLAQSHEVTRDLFGLGSPEQAQSSLAQSNIFFVARTTSQDGRAVLYFSAKTVDDAILLLEVGFNPDGSAKACIKSQRSDLAGALLDFLSQR
mmetsp:Transcript_28691/g.80199  ORF Transcript_28691/g.80199 Transcript_28691/m.80199 type:complete len:944 (+) Transcript_28691:130-2961(+)|eukprot:CAMPEP_0119131500 /NCGR_PEP_ID=MMETSP1310-20130426/10415_1 /TAXON_ID=464262 /ORGANISM="Genus nov. species nov., Strain RCC2339" /LENGTH=943 /DNA_ID=CAMNT_0007122077 /DNA_START=72 /DNA_END=2903 /DNA_ORIENTATION=-